MSKQYLDKDGLQVVADKVNESKEVASGAMALAEQANENITMTFTGTYAQWNNLSAVDKAKYTIVNITDDVGDSSMTVRNPDWDNAVSITIAQLDSGYTFTGDGLFVCTIKPNSGTYAGININGIPVGVVTVDPQRGQIQCPVKESDVVQTTTGTMHTTAEGSAYFIPYTVSVETVPMNYSTEEQFTGKFWIDGKKIYRKCYEGSITTYTDYGALRQFQTNVDSNSDIDAKIDVEGYMQTAPYVQKYSINETEGNGGNGFYQTAQVRLAGTIPNQTLAAAFYDTGKALTSIAYHFCIYYTKTN